MSEIQDWKPDMTLDEALAALDRVRALCAESMAEGVDGKPTNVDSLWPTDVLAAIDDGPRCRFCW